MTTGMADAKQQKIQVSVDQGAAGQPPGPEQLAEEVWDEERLEKAMKTLKEMHIQVSRMPKSLSGNLMMSPFSYASFELRFLDSSHLWLPSNHHVCPNALELLLPS